MWRNVCLLTRTGNIILRIKSNEKTDKGVSLLEVLLVIGIMVMVIPKVYENIENHLNNVRWQNAAEHANTYNTAVRNYVADNASTLLAGSLPKTITPATSFRKAI